MGETEDSSWESSGVSEQSRRLGHDLSARQAGLHAARPQDEAFLRELYASTRWNELAPTGWSDAVKNAFLAQQWDAQRRHYRQHHSLADHLIVTHREGGAIGRLIVDWRPPEVRLIDVALLPGWRGRGIGSALLGALCRQADRLGLPVAGQVETSNPARRLYARLGFSIGGSEDGGDAMRLRLYRAATGPDGPPHFPVPFPSLPLEITHHE